MVLAENQKIRISSKAENIILVERMIEDVCDVFNISEDYYGNILVAITEAVNNAIKHGRAKNITIGLNTQNNQVELTVQDDGCGFAAARDTQLEGRGFGLKNITERARTMGGQVRIHSSPGEGTRVEVTIPVR